LTTDIGELRARLSLEAQQFRQGMEETRSQLSQTGRSAQSVSKDFDRIQKASLGLGTAIVAGVGASIKTAADFEAQMSRVKAISGATDDEFKNLQKSALDLGASTSKSASEVAVAFEDMAAKGFNANQIMAAMPGVIAAAEASGSDLALTADVVASALNGFQMEASDASKVADILAKTANISAASMDDMGYAFKYVGPVANSLGLSIEEVSAAIGIMADSGIDGSSAGTALRAALLALNNPAKEQEKLMKSLGFSMKDSDGKAKNLSQIFAGLTKATEGMTKAEKVATIAKLVGTEASSGMLSVMEGGVDKLDDFTKSLKNSTGASKQAADVMKDNLKGAVDEFSGALESAGIEIGKDFLPTLTKIVKEVTGVMGSFDIANIKGSLAFGGTTAAVALLMSTIGKLGFALKTLSASPMGLAITGISLLTGVIAGAVVKNKELDEAMLDNIKTRFDEAKSIEDMVTKYDDLRSKSVLTNDEFARFIDIQSEMKKTSDPKVLENLSKEAEKLQKKSGLSNEELSEMVQLNGDLIEKVPEATGKISEQGNKILDNTKYIKEYNKAHLDSLYKDLEIEKIKTETKYRDLLIDEKNLKQEMRDKEADLQELLGKRASAIEKAKDEEDKLNKMLGNSAQYSEAAINAQIEKTASAKNEEEILQKQVEKKAEGIQKTQDDLDKTRDKIKALEDVRSKMAQIILAQMGLTSEQGKELETIDGAINKLEGQKKKIQETTPYNQRNTDIYRDAVKAVDDQIARLQSAKKKVEEITVKAADMNTALGKAIFKDVTIRETKYQIVKLQNSSGRNTEYHTGGITGKNPINRIPTLHVGGLAAQFANAPTHNEIDVRLLRNEMVLTESQQANLMRMIDAGITPSGSSGNSEVVELLQQLIHKTDALGNRPIQGSVIMDSREVGELVEPHVSQRMNSNFQTALRSSGLQHRY
jgi:TP901 family phage tail tape measure protein